MLIGITGKAGAGKDTFATYFVRKGWQRYSLADPIKRMIEVGFNIDKSVWDNRDLKEGDIPWLGRSPRYLAQTLGTEWGRNIINSELWLLLAEQALLREPKLIIPDIRFENEARWVHDHGGIVIRVSRTSDLLMDNPAHVSERGISDDYVSRAVVNDGTISELHKSAARVMTDYVNGGA